VTRQAALLREAAVALAASAIMALVAIHLGVSDRAFLIYADGDSMLPPIVHGAVVAGGPLDLSLSSPLFLPELALYLLLGALGLPTAAALTVQGIVTWLGLYAAIRFTAGAARDRRAPLASSPDRDALQGASLLFTGTYYSATVVGTVLVLGLLARLWHAPRHPIALVVIASVVAACSTLTNPLFLLWASAPLVVVAGIGMATRLVRPAPAVLGIAALAAGGVLGMLGRIPFAPLLTQDAGAKIQPDHAADSARYYGGLVADLARTPAGAAEIALVLLCLAGAIGATVVGVRRRDRIAMTLGVFGWLAPLLAAGAVVLAGTMAARYLQPVFLFPPLALLPLVGRLPRSRAVLAAPVALTLLLALIAPGALTPTRLPAQIAGDIACVDRWVAASGETGAGQFWTVRAPKAYLADTRRLVQVDAAMNPYLWLVDSEDYRGLRAVSFVIDSPDSPPTHVAAPAGTTPTITVCGRYTITDYGAPVLPLGTPHH
jgi:hypothetical protein